MLVSHTKYRLKNTKQALELWLTLNLLNRGKTQNRTVIKRNISFYRNPGKMICLNSRQITRNWPNWWMQKTRNFPNWLWLCHNANKRSRNTVSKCRGSWIFQRDSWQKNSSDKWWDSPRLTKSFCQIRKFFTTRIIQTVLKE